MNFESLPCYAGKGGDIKDEYKGWNATMTETQVN